VEAPIVTTPAVKPPIVNDLCAVRVGGYLQMKVVGRTQPSPHDESFRNLLPGWAPQPAEQSAKGGDRSFGPQASDPPERVGRLVHHCNVRNIHETASFRATACRREP
jgi:hypothetical protein